MLADCAWSAPVTAKSGPLAAEACLTFDSFDGGGPQYKVILNTDIVVFERHSAYSKPDHAEMDGAGYRVSFAFRGLKAGKGTLTIQVRSPIAENEDRRYAVTVDENLHVSITLLDIKPL